jgi:hypothetical protein
MNKLVESLHEEAKRLRCKVVAVVQLKKDGIPFFFPTIRNARSFMADMESNIPQCTVELFEVK